jgi:putative endonuclease
VTSARRALGARGEDVAAEWYVRQGYEVVARNWRCRDGELDLVVRMGRTYVFCEVKTRTTDRFGAPVEAVTRNKQVRIRRLAARWLQEGANGPAKDIRFDVVSVLGPQAVEVLEGAF